MSLFSCRSFRLYRVAPYVSRWEGNILKTLVAHWAMTLVHYIKEKDHSDTGPLRYVPSMRPNKLRKLQMYNLIRVILKLQELVTAPISPWTR